MFDRVAGLARSIAIYHAIPFRQRRLRQLYGRFVSRGDLVVDVGAHAGNHVRALAAIGCRVIAIEPQPDFARVLRLLFGRSARVTILETAVSDRSGRAELSISERTPTVTSLASDWRDARAHDADFAQVRWNRRVEIGVTTLDALFAQHAIDDSGAGQGIAGGGGETENLELGTVQCQGEREGIVNVHPDIGIDDDLLGRSGMGRGGHVKVGRLRLRFGSP